MTIHAMPMRQEPMLELMVNAPVMQTTIVEVIIGSVIIIHASTNPTAQITVFAMMSAEITKYRPRTLGVLASHAIVWLWAAIAAANRTTSCAVMTAKNIAMPA